jgi:hypothetical protein
MRVKRLGVITCLALVVAWTGAAWGQGTSGSQFLGIGIGARAVGMGGASVALGDEGTALAWNPAGLLGARSQRVTFTHLSWLSDASYQFASFVAPIGENAALGVDLEHGAVSWDNMGAGSFEAGDFMGGFGYGRRLTPSLGVGAGLKYLSSKLGEDSAASYALDAGAICTLSDAASLGVAVRNVGPGLAFRTDEDPLPLTLTVGGAYRWRTFTLAVDVEKQNDLETSTRFGVEYAPMSHLALRGGYVAGQDSALGDFSGGLGLSWNDRWSLDYAYRPSELGATHQFAVSAGLGGGDSAGSVGGGSEAPSSIPVSSVPRSNLAVVTDLTREVVREALDRMKLPEGAPVYLSQVDQNEANWLVQSILLEELTAEGHTVMSGGLPMSAGDQAAAGYEISYRIVSCQTTFPRVWREWVIGARKVERKTRCSIFFKLSDSSKAIIWAGDVEREKREIIPGDRLSELSTPGQGFVSPEVETGGWDKVLEPVVVAGIVGGLIYLFYTSRSGG